MTTQSIPRSILPFDPHAAQLDSPEQSLAVSPEVIRALLTAGFHTLQCNRTDEAARIFRFIVSVRPDRDFGVIGLALAALTDMRFDEAEKLLADARRRIPESADIKAFLVLTLILGGKTGQAKALHASLQEDDPGMSASPFAHCLSKELSLRANPLRDDWRHSGIQPFLKPSTGE